MVSFHIPHSEDLVPAIQSLEDYFREGETSIMQAAFKHTYFVHPDAVRDRTPYFPDRARRSREHYPGIDKGKRAHLESWRRKGSYPGRQLEGPDGVGEVHWSQTYKEIRLWSAPHLGKHP